MSEDFWTSAAGIELRLQDLAESLTWTAINETIEILGEESGLIDELDWVSEIDDVTCKYCLGQSGRSYKIGGLLPAMPAHNKCRCHWSPRSKLPVV